MDTRTGIRDFIYLDVERVRSIVAQRAGGLLSESTSGAEHKAGGKAAAEGGLPFLAKATGELDYHYTKSHTETRSIHDALFSEFYQGLEEAECFFSGVFPDGESWKEERFKDGAILVVTGVFRITDYDLQVESIRNLPSLYKTIAQASTVQSGAQTNQAPANAQRNPQSNNQRRNTQQDNQDYMPEALRNVPIKEAADLIERFYGGTIRVRVYPFLRENGKVFLGSAERQSFRMNPRNLMSLYGPVIDASWTAVIQVNKGVHHNPSDFTNPTGAGLENQIESMGDLFVNMATFTLGVQFPSIAMTPIAIYRDI